MRTLARNVGRLGGRALLSLCRCDGWKDAFVVAILAVLGAFLIRLAPGPERDVRHGGGRLTVAPAAHVLPV
jgi:hypothetical protein